MLLGSWRFSLMVSGGKCATATGIKVRPRWFVGSLGTRQWWTRGVCQLGTVAYGSLGCSVPGVKMPSLIASITGGAPWRYTLANRQSGSSASSPVPVHHQVNQSACCRLHGNCRCQYSTRVAHVLCAGLFQYPPAFRPPSVLSTDTPTSSTEPSSESVLATPIGIGVILSASVAVMFIIATIVILVILLVVQRSV